MSADGAEDRLVHPKDHMSEAVVNAGVPLRDRYTANTKIRVKQAVLRQEATVASIWTVFTPADDGKGGIGRWCRMSACDHTQYSRKRSGRE